MIGGGSTDRQSLNRGLDQSQPSKVRCQDTFFNTQNCCHYRRRLVGSTVTVQTYDSGGTICNVGFRFLTKLNDCSVGRGGLSVSTDGTGV